MALIGHALRILPVGIDGRALRGGRGEARSSDARRGGRSRASSPGPVQSIRCAGGSWRHALPPDIAVVGQGDVGENRVRRHRGHRVRVRRHRRARSDAEEPGLRIDRAQPAILLPARARRCRRRRASSSSRRRDSPRRHEHGEIGFAAGAGKRGGRRRSSSHPARASPRMSMCSAIHPSSRAMPRRCAARGTFCPSSALPP